MFSLVAALVCLLAVPVSCTDLLTVEAENALSNFESEYQEIQRFLAECGKLEISGDQMILNLPEFSSAVIHETVLSPIETEVKKKIALYSDILQYFMSLPRNVSHLVTSDITLKLLDVKKGLRLFENFSVSDSLRKLHGLKIPETLETAYNEFKAALSEVKSVQKFKSSSQPLLEKVRIVNDGLSNFIQAMDIFRNFLSKFKNEITKGSHQYKEIADDFSRSVNKKLAKFHELHWVAVGLFDFLKEINDNGADIPSLDSLEDVKKADFLELEGQVQHVAERMRSFMTFDFAQLELTSENILPHLENLKSIEKNLPALIEDLSKEEKGGLKESENITDNRLYYYFGGGAVLLGIIGIGAWLFLRKS
jgi:hypothetical protein